MKKLDSLFKFLAAIVSLGFTAHISAAPGTPAGTVVSWGSQVIPYVAPETRFTKIAAGYDCSLGLTSDGTLMGLGLDPAGLSRDGLKGVTAMAVGEFHRVAVKSDGTVIAWGNNFFGQLSVPVGSTGVVAVAAGKNHSLALRSDGTVIGWGWDAFGQTSVPNGLTGVISIAAGRIHSLALRSNGTVVAWGYTGDAPVPWGLGGVVAIATGDAYNLALKSDGSVVAWGGNFYGQGTPELPITTA